LELTEKLNSILQNLPYLASEIFLILAFIVIVIVELLIYHKNSTEAQQNESQVWIWGFSLAIVLFVVYITVSQPNIIGYISSKESYFISGVPSVFFKIIILIAALILLFHIKILNYKLPNEFYPLFIFQIFGLFLLTISTNFLLIYIAIEIVSIASYAFTALNLSKKAAEASIKYALFGGISSAVMLYGMSLLYGATGTLDLLNPDFSRYLNQIDQGALSMILLMTLAGFLFKITAFPFHLWAPDVYEATPTPVISFMSVAPKAGGILVLSRLMMVIPESQKNLFIIVAIFSIAIGNFTALRQTNAKRMLAYSTIAQAGFLMGGLATLSNLGLQSSYFYLFGYIFSNMLAFFLIDLAEKQRGNENAFLISNFKGLGIKNPFWGILIIVTMISLIGLPPTVGFTGKLFVFSAVWENYQITNNKFLLFLFAFGLLNTVIALYYYLKIPFIAFFRKEDNEGASIKVSNIQYLFSIIIALPILFYFFKSDLLMNWIQLILK
jgi:NADH-quinone oxidoreductase subunit N